MGLRFVAVSPTAWIASISMFCSVPIEMAQEAICLQPILLQLDVLFAGPMVAWWNRLAGSWRLCC